MRDDLNRASDLLSHCLVEEEGAALRSPQRRRLSMLLSVSLQAVLLGAALLIPILVNGEKLQTTFLATPRVPYHRGNPGPPPEQTQSSTQRPGRPVPLGKTVICLPPTIPPNVATIIDPPSEIGPNRGGSIPGDGGDDGIPNFSWLSSDRRGPVPPVPPVNRPPVPKGPIKVHDGMQAARLIHRVDPTYTPFLRSIRAEGVVKLRAVIATDGTVKELEVIELKGHPLLARRAIEAIEQWRYQPWLLNGQPVEVETHITVIFTTK